MDKKNREDLSFSGKYRVDSMSDGNGFKDICVQISGIFAILDNKFKIIDASEDFFIATTSTTDILGHSIFQISPPFYENNTEDYLTSLKSSLNRVVAKLVPDIMQLRENVVTNQSDWGDEIKKQYVSYSNSPILNEKGELSYIVFKAEDVTQFVQAGKKIADCFSKERCTNVHAPTSQAISFDHIGDGNYLPRVLLLSTNPETVQIVSSALKDSYRFFQTVSCEWALQSIYSFNPTVIIIGLDCPDKIRSLLDSLRADKELANTPVFVIGSSTTEISNIFTRDSLTEPISIPISTQQVRKQVDNAIAKNQRLQIEQSRLAALVASSEDAIIGAKLDGTITDWNAGAERIFGYTPEEILGKSVQILVPPEMSKDKSKIMDRIAQGERVQQYETIRMCKDGERIYVSTSISPIRNHQGIIIGASAITRDITQRKKLSRR